MDRKKLYQMFSGNGKYHSFRKMEKGYVNTALFPEDFDVVETIIQNFNSLYPLEDNICLDFCMNVANNVKYKSEEDSYFNILHLYNQMCFYIYKDGSLDPMTEEELSLLAMMCVLVKNIIINN